MSLFQAGQSILYFRLMDKLGAGGMGEGDKANERMLWALMAAHGKLLELAKVRPTSYPLNLT
jgi:hypothetical protein